MNWIHFIRRLIVFLAIITGTAILFSCNSKEKDLELAKKNRNVVTTYRSTIKNNAYSHHVSTGKALTGKPFKNIEAIEDAFKKGYLSRVKNTKGVIVDDLTHSRPFLQTDAADLLVEIGKEFHKRSSGKRFIVTSLTRPIEKQRELSKSNLNASPNISSHSYGVSFDIAYTKFNKNKKYNHDAHRIIEEILKEYQANKSVYVIREKQSACYHVTVRK